MGQLLGWLELQLQYFGRRPAGCFACSVLYEGSYGHEYAWHGTEGIVIKCHDTT